MVTPAELLGVSADAPQEELRRVFRRLCRACHPDRMRGHDGPLPAALAAVPPEDRFATMMKAYEKLSGGDRMQAEAGAVVVLCEGDVTESPAWTHVRLDPTTAALVCRCGADNLLRIHKDAAYTLFQCKDCSIWYKVVQLDVDQASHEG